MTEVHICPVCEGKGLVPYGFYKLKQAFSEGDITVYWEPTNTPLNEMCRSCNGTGYVILNTLGGYE